MSNNVISFHLALLWHNGPFPHQHHQQLLQSEGIWFRSHSLLLPTSDFSLLVFKALVNRIREPCCCRALIFHLIGHFRQRPALQWHLNCCGQDCHDVSVHRLGSRHFSFCSRFRSGLTQGPVSVLVLLPSSLVSLLGVSLHFHACPSPSVPISSQTSDCGLSGVSTLLAAFWLYRIHHLSLSHPSLCLLLWKEKSCFYTFSEEMYLFIVSLKAFSFRDFLWHLRVTQ